MKMFKLFIIMIIVILPLYVQAQVTVSGTITNAETGEPVPNILVGFMDLQIQQPYGTMTDFEGHYDAVLGASAGMYGLGIEDPMGRFEDFYEMRFLNIGMNNWDAGLTPVGVEGYTITYNMFMEIPAPPPFGDQMIPLSVLPETVDEGDPFIIPEYPLDQFPELGADFQVLMRGLSGTTLTIPEGSLNQDVIINVVLKNLQAGIDPVEMNLTLEGYISPDPNLQGEIWCDAEFQVFDSQMNRLNDGEDFAFEENNQMSIQYPTDNEFFEMLDLFGIDYDNYDAAYWVGDGWDQEGILTDILVGYYFEVQLPHLSEVICGPEGGFEAPEVIATLTGTVENSNGSPLGNALVQLGASIVNNLAFTDELGNYSIIGIPAGTYPITIHADGYQYFSDNVTIDEENEVFDATLADGVPGTNTLTYLMYFQPYDPVVEYPPIQISAEGELVPEGDTFVIPDYDLAVYPMLGPSFQIYMDGISGSTITVPEGGIDQDITVHMIVKNMIVIGDPLNPLTWPLEIESIASPDPDLEDLLWMYAEYEVFDADGTRLNGENYHFYFNNGFPMQTDIITDQDFSSMMDELGQHYTQLAAAYWNVISEGWVTDGIVGESLEESFRYTVEHFSDIAGGPEGGFGGGGEPTVLTVPLQANYFELVSSNLDLEDLAVESVFGDVADLVVVYQNDGDMFIPDVLNTINDIDLTQGYRVFCSAPSEWTVEGTVMDPATQYTITAGPWNWIGYPLADEINVENAMGHIAPQITIVQADDGGMWIPSIPLNTMGNMVPGTGYMAISNEDVTFEYFPPVVASATTPDVWEIPDVEDTPTPTGLPYGVLVRMTDELKAQTPAIIELYDGTTLVGKSAMLENRELTPVVAWQADREHNLSGFTPGHTITVKVLTADGTLLANRNSGSFGEGAFAEITLDASGTSLPSEFSVASAYPNPFNPSVTIPFSLPQAGGVSIVVFNVLGQQVFNQVQNYEAGTHQFVFDATSSNLVSGLYFLQVQYNGQVNTQKVMLLK